MNRIILWPWEKPSSGCFSCEISPAVLKELENDPEWVNIQKEAEETGEVMCGGVQYDNMIYAAIKRMKKNDVAAVG